MPGGWGSGFQQRPSGKKHARGELVGQKYPWGDSIDKDKANYRAKNSPIGLKLANSYGEQNKHKLYNMVGNVWEWCLDDYDPDFYAGSPKENPLAVNQKQSLKWLVDNFTNVDLDTHAVSRGRRIRRLVPYVKGCSTQH